MNANYQLYVFNFLISLSGIYLLGNLLVSGSGFRPEEKYARLFSKMLTGLVIWVLIISFSITHLNTVNLGFLIVVPAFYFQVRHARSYGKIAAYILKDLKEEVLFLLQIFAAGVLVMAVRYWWSFAIYDYPIVHIDHVFYAKVSEYLLQFGVETSRLEYIFPETIRVQPYHFFELWLNAGFLKLFGGSSVSLLVLITYTLGLSLVWLGLCAIAEQYFKVTPGIKLLCLLGLFLMGVNYPYYSILLKNGFPINASVFDYAKLFPVYLFFIAALLLSNRNKIMAALTMLLGLPLLTIIAAPATFLSIGFYSLILFWKRERVQGIRLGLATLAVGLFLAWFYSRTATSSTTPYGRYLFSNSNGIFSFQNFFVGVKLFVTICLMICVLYMFHWVLILSFGKFKSLKVLAANRFFSIGLIFLFSGLGSWVFLSSMLNALQFFSNVSIPVINLLVFTGLLISLRLTRYRAQLVICFMFIFLMNFSVNIARLFFRPVQSPKYVETVLKRTQNLNPVGGFIKASSDYGSVFLKASNVYPAGTFMNLSPEHSDFHAVNLSVFDIPVDTSAARKALEQQMVENTSFYQFVKQQKQNGTFTTIAQSQAQFVQQYNIEYILVSKAGKLPATLISKVEAPVVDPFSGEKFYLLKKQAGEHKSSEM
jgi:hypothetical protein